ncbi:PREDICTED: putative E3 ubiquitin-protein ligase LIN-1 isoform X1 [Theobroma cacao]|uniref:E3 ubiquitin-protein ligase LIN-1 isoform X1 n=1 Tax=Theobroma cacao TaxID=3641 RepID=A0AB32WCD8_THECC|nr:PREDICTED: putative E3 ubiquitin-protein ligase LIN-1 isoform X1 [Theobroma cacao]
MSSNFMAPVSPPSAPSVLASSCDHDSPDLESIRVLVFSINRYICELITDNETRNSLRLKCTSRLNFQKQEFFEFSEQAVLSNLYWGIDSIEAAFQSKWPEEKTSRLKNSEKMLQVPALLDEQGVTAGVPNEYLVCCSYFYLSIVKNLQKDQLEAALHFLQAILVSPILVRTQFASELCESVFLSCTKCETQDMGQMRRLQSVPRKDFAEDNLGELTRQMARRYKHWLMYYRVTFYGETTQRQHGRSDILSPAYESQNFGHEKASCTESSKSTEHRYQGQSNFKQIQYEKVHPVDPQDVITESMKNETQASTKAKENHVLCKAIKDWDHIPRLQLQSMQLYRDTSSKRLQDVLKESQSDTPSVNSGFIDFEDEYDLEENMEDYKTLLDTTRTDADDQEQASSDQKLHPLYGTSGQENKAIMFPQAPERPTDEDVIEANIAKYFPERLIRSVKDINLSVLEIGDKKVNTLHHVEDDQSQLEPQKVQLFEHIAPTYQRSKSLIQMKQERTAAREKLDSYCWGKYSELRLSSRKDSKSELLEIIEKLVSKLCFSDGLEKSGKDYAVEVTAIYRMLNNRQGVKYAMLKDVILDQLLIAVSTSKDETVIRASVTVLTTIISANISLIEDIKGKGLQLSDLARALKRNVHEAATLIHLIKPSPAEIKTLELLPTLVEVICTSDSYRCRPPKSVPLTPPVASLMIIEVLVTAFDFATNNMHLAAINSPRVLSGLLDVARNHSLEEHISLATILVKCMQFDGQCRKYISQVIAVAPFIHLLQSNEKRAWFIALEYFHEVLQIPRSSAISQLQQIQKEGGISVMNMLMTCVRQLQPDYQLLAANLLLQLDTLENSSSKSVFRKEAMQVLLQSIASEESSNSQLLSAFILSNIGGTYAWTGESYTVAWLVKKAGLTSMYHRNMIRNFDWLDQSLQDAGIDSWCSKIARSFSEFGEPAFIALQKGLRSQIKRVARDSLTTIAWLGCEISKTSDRLRYSACEILLGEVEKFLHPGMDLEERLLACLCVYNYASGKGMKKLIHFSEGVRESLRRFSNVIWMAEELHRVADFYLSNKSRISCVHTQILEASHRYSGAVTALIYYKGMLYSGYSDGSIKVWDVRKQSATLVWDTKEHKKAVTCFSLFEPGESLLSGSADKTIGVWQMVQNKLECIEVIATKEPIQKLETYGQMIFVITQGHRFKVFDSSRTVNSICKSRSVKCMRIVQGRIYAGCTDSSIQELSITSNNEREIKAPVKKWRMQSKPINSIIMYRDWLYSASSMVEGSNIREWRRNSEPQMSMVPEKGANILAMEVVEDFIYLNCSSSASSLQIWLRGTQQKVGRISAGSKITSLITANDIVLCGTESGIIKGWIPL